VTKAIIVEEQCTLTTQKFDPFISRRARDIRNSLSETIIRSLDNNDAEPFRRAGKELLASDLAPAHYDYVRDRLGRYEQVFSEVQQRRLGDTFSQAIELWEKGLFFEAHERWETTWQGATGERRMAIKGLIKAAGVYVHMEQGHEQAAKTLAGKASALRREHGSILPSFLDLNELLEKLETQDPDPPQLSKRGQRGA
jgi:hypothetical protein